MKQEERTTIVLAQASILHLLNINQVQYLPNHKCPKCGAPGIPNDRANWISPYRNYSEASHLWCGSDDRVGYVLFACSCPHDYGRQMLVVHLGDAILPIPQLDDHRYAVGDLDPYDVNNGIRMAVEINIRRVAQAVYFLASTAEPHRLANIDQLRLILYAVSVGTLPPDVAYEQIVRLFRRETTAPFVAVKKKHPASVPAKA